MGKVKRNFQIDETVDKILNMIKEEAGISRSAFVDKAVKRLINEMYDLIKQKRWEDFLRQFTRM